MRKVLLSPRWWWLHGFVVLGVLVMLRLGLWQWHRAESPSGGLQNYAYAFQWPLFAVFAIVLWWRTLRIEANRAAEAVMPAEGSDGAVAPHRSMTPFPVADITERDGVRIGLMTDMAPGDESDDEVRLYNAYLAQLNDRAGVVSSNRGG